MPHYIWDRYVTFTHRKLGVPCLKIVSTVPKIWGAVPIFFARVNGVLKNDVESCLRVTASNQAQFPLHACKLSSVVHLIFPKIKRFVFNRFIRNKYFFYSFRNLRN